MHLQGFNYTLICKSRLQKDYFQLVSLCFFQRVFKSFQLLSNIMETVHDSTALFTSMWAIHNNENSCNISRRRMGNGCISSGCQSSDDISTVLLDYCESLLYAASSMQCRSVYCGPVYVRFIVTDINPICSYNGINTWIYSFGFSVNNIPTCFDYILYFIRLSVLELGQKRIGSYYF